MSSAGQDIDISAHGANSTTLIMQVWWVRETSAFIQATWRSVGGLACMLAIAAAIYMDPTEAKMWVGAAVAGVGIGAGVVQKVTEIKKG